MLRRNNPCVSWAPNALHPCFRLAQGCRQRALSRERCFLRRRLSRKTQPAQTRPFSAMAVVRAPEADPQWVGTSPPPPCFLLPKGKWHISSALSPRHSAGKDKNSSTGMKPNGAVPANSLPCKFAFWALSGFILRKPGISKVEYLSPA